MMLGAGSFFGTAKAVLAGALPLPGIGEHRGTPAGSAHPEPKDDGLTAPIDTHPMSATARRGQEIRRSLSTRDATRWFVEELQSRDLVGERTWRALWDCYVWFCEEADLVPLPSGMQARFAQELSQLCQRGQVRLREGGKLRRLTTYTVPVAASADLRAAA